MVSAILPSFDEECLFPVMLWYVVTNLIFSEFKLGPAVCTNPAQSRRGYPVFSVLLSVEPSAVQVEAPDFLFLIVTDVCLLRLFAMVATVSP